MLTLTIPAVTTDLWDEENEVFITSTSSGERTLHLEHSLISLSKWESKWKKPFLATNDKTTEQVIDYIKLMTLDKNVPDEIYDRFTKEHYKQIDDYLNDPMTATTINERNQPPRSREIITSEIIYYWMIAFNIPFECEKWHINRLLTLIRVCGIKNEPPKKRGKADIARSYAAINAARRKRLGTKG